MEPFKIKLMEALSTELQFSDYATESLVPSLDQTAIKNRMQAIFDGSGAKHKAMPTIPRQLRSPSIEETKTSGDALPPSKETTEEAAKPKVKVPKPVGLARFSKCMVSVVFGSARKASLVGRGGSSSDDASEVEMEDSLATEGIEPNDASPGSRLSTRSTFRRRTYFRER